MLLSVRQSWHETYAVFCLHRHITLHAPPACREVLATRAPVETFVIAALPDLARSSEKSPGHVLHSPCWGGYLQVVLHLLLLVTPPEKLVTPTPKDHTDIFASCYVRCKPEFLCSVESSYPYRQGTTDSVHAD
jgi:hypothetical protein